MNQNRSVRLEHLPVFDMLPDLAKGPFPVTELALVGYRCDEPDLAPYIIGPYHAYILGIIKDFKIEMPDRPAVTEDLLLTMGLSDVVEFEDKPGAIIPLRWDYALRGFKENSSYSNHIVSSYQVIKKFSPGELIMRHPQYGEFGPDDGCIMSSVL